MHPDSPNPTRILRKPAVLDRVGFSGTTLWRLERAGRFPRHIRLSDQAVGWDEAEIEEWLAARKRSTGPASEQARVLDQQQRARSPHRRSLLSEVLDGLRATLIQNNFSVAHVETVIEKLTTTSKSLPPHLRASAAFIQWTEMVEALVTVNGTTPDHARWQRATAPLRARWQHRPQRLDREILAAWAQLRAETKTYESHEGA